MLQLVCVCTCIHMHAYTAVVEDYPVMLCRLKFTLLTQNWFGHPEIKTGYMYRFLAIQLNLPVGAHDRSSHNLDVKALITGQILLYIQSKKKIFIWVTFYTIRAFCCKTSL